MLILRRISSFLQAILPFIGFSFISIVVFDQVNSPYNIILSIIIFVFGLFSSVFVYNMMIKRGVIETLSGSMSSPDLDNLEESENDGIKKVNPSELEILFKENVIPILKCTVSIWGDKHGRKLDQFHDFKSIDFDELKNTLKITYQDKSTLTIRNPSIIQLSSSYIKVTKATEVLWSVKNQLDEINYYAYLNKNGKIITKSNTNWIPHKYDIGIGFDSVYIQFN